MVLNTKVSIDLSGYKKRTQKFSKAISEVAVEIANSLAEEGAEVARFALNDAVTDFGEERMSRGDGISEGRNRSGRMISQLRALKTSVNQREEIARARVGWYFPQPYFKYQEEGTGAWYNSNSNYDPSFDYSATYSRISGERKGGIVGAHSLWEALRHMENIVSNFEDDARDFIRTNIG